MVGDMSTTSAAAPIPADIASLADYERHAAGLVAPEVWRHIQSGEGAERSLADNRRQFDRWRLVADRLVPLSGGDTAVTLLGQRHAAPILLAPIAYHRMVHAEGEIATIGAATALDTTMVVSTLSSVPMEAVADAARATAVATGRALPPLWFQLYLQRERAHSLALVQRAEAAGYGVIVVTVDAAVKRSGFTLPDGVEAANLRDFPPATHRASAAAGAILFGSDLADAAPTWDDIAWLRGQTRLPILLKGLVSAGDARRALEHGVDGIIVSNHGGRVLDDLVPPMLALPAIADATGGALPLLLDSGIRRGTDVVKALALGAQAVLIGRPQLHALAVAGLPGVAHMLHMLRAELELAMAQLGRPSIAEIDGSVLLA
jgi:4-hydroxymandelate oxidase